MLLVVVVVVVVVVLVLVVVMYADDAGRRFTMYPTRFPTTQNRRH